MDVKDTIQHYSKTKIKVKEQHFYFCSKFHSHNRVFENEYNLIP
jgi:hypothetical protein